MTHFTIQPLIKALQLECGSTAIIGLGSGADLLEDARLKVRGLLFSFSGAECTYSRPTMGIFVYPYELTFIYLRLTSTSEPRPSPTS